MECIYMGPKVNLCQFEISNWHEFLFRLHEDFIAPSLWNNYFWLWDDSFAGKKDSEVVIKSTSFVKIFWWFNEHLFFGCFDVCIYYIDSVTSLTFYLKSGSYLPKKLVLFVWLKALLIEMMKILILLILKALFVLKIFKFLPLLFGHVRKTAW